MDRATRSIDIDTPVTDFYALLTDFDAYPQFLSDVTSTQVLRHEGNVWDVQFTVRVIREVQYVLRLTGVPNQSLHWTLESGQLFKTNDGGWDLEDLGGRTRATYSLSVTVTRFVPNAITRRLVDLTFPNMLGQWKRHAEGA
jgi:ribosome-associated toxin RatA of RatAB toxin-antitoxin module